MDPLESLGLHAAILAAGPSTRFGSPKQLVRLEGGLVLHRAVANAASVAGHSVTVVIGAHAREVAPALRLSSASVVLNRDWAEGLASTIRAAVRGTPPRCEGLLLLLADQVAVAGEALRRLFAAWRRHPVLSQQHSTAAHPGCRQFFRAGLSPTCWICGAIETRVRCFGATSIGWFGSPCRTPGSPSIRPRTCSRSVPRMPLTGPLERAIIRTRRGRAAGPRAAN